MSKSYLTHSFGNLASYVTIKYCQRFVSTLTNIPNGWEADMEQADEKEVTTMGMDKKAFT
jgi:hypothetical protein